MQLIIVLTKEYFQIMLKLLAFLPWINTPMINTPWLIFDPVSVLNTFSKNYEKIVKNFLISKMKQNFSPFLSAYRKSFSTEHVLIRLLEDWRNKLDNNNVVGANSTDLSKAFDCILKPLIVDSMTYWWLNLMHMVSIELL